MSTLKSLFLSGLLSSTLLLFSTPGLATAYKIVNAYGTIYFGQGSWVGNGGKPLFNGMDSLCINASPDSSVWARDSSPPNEQCNYGDFGSNKTVILTITKSSSGHIVCNYAFSDATCSPFPKGPSQNK